MPTNLPPEYFEVERRYKAAQSTEDRIACLEELISTVPKHKGTDKLRADLRRRLAKLRDEAQTRKGASRQLSAFHIDKEGAGQAVLVGPANTGKSALVAALTNATPEVAPYPFTTWTPTPGMMPIENIQVQLIDTPPLNQEYVEPELLQLIRRADLILLMVDLQAYPIQQIEETVAFLEECRILPSAIPLLVVVNKTDDAQADADFEVLCELLGEAHTLVPVSAETGRHVDRLKQAIYDALGIMRVYSKPPGADPDRSAPFVLPLGSTVEEFAGKVHQDFIKNLKSARLWGSAAFDGQMVARDHILHEGDVIELRA